MRNMAESLRDILRGYWKAGLTAVFLGALFGSGLVYWRMLIQPQNDLARTVATWIAGFASALVVAHINNYHAAKRQAREDERSRILEVMKLYAEMIRYSKRDHTPGIGPTTKESVALQKLVVLNGHLLGKELKRRYAVYLDSCDLARWQDFYEHLVSEKKRLMDLYHERYVAGWLAD